MKRITLILVLVGFLRPVSGATDADNSIFGDSSPLKINITTDINALWSNRVDPEYQSALISITGESWQIGGKTEVKIAGKSRRALCELPPLRVKLKNMNQPWQNKISKLKIVLGCSANEVSNDEVIKEYLSYKLYNTIAPESYAVRLAEITILDLEGNIAEYTMGFILEPDSHLEQRVCIEEMKKKNLNTAQLINAFYRERNETSSARMNTVSIFQFMIGNTDWNVHTRQNVKIFEKEGVLIPVPYDFDLAGLVDASYAEPQQEVPIDNVTQRFYQGYCLTADDLAETISIFNNKKEDLFAIVAEAPLSKGKQAHCQSYLKQFYRTINDSKKLNKYLVENCKIFGHLDNIPGSPLSNNY